MAVKGTECRRAEKRSGGANLKVFQETPLVRKLMKTPAQSEPTTKSHRWRAGCGVESLQNQKKNQNNQTFSQSCIRFSHRLILSVILKKSDLDVTHG